MKNYVDKCEVKLDGGREKEFREWMGREKGVSLLKKIATNIPMKFVKLVKEEDWGGKYNLPEMPSWKRLAKKKAKLEKAQLEAQAVKKESVADEENGSVSLGGGAASTSAAESRAESIKDLAESGVDDDSAGGRVDSADDGGTAPVTPTPVRPLQETESDEMHQEAEMHLETKTAHGDGDSITHDSELGHMLAEWSATSLDAYDRAVHMTLRKCLMEGLDLGRGAAEDKWASDFPTSWESRGFHNRDEFREKILGFAAELRRADSAVRREFQAIGTDDGSTAAMAAEKADLKTQIERVLAVVEEIRDFLKRDPRVEYLTLDSRKKFATFIAHAPRRNSAGSNSPGDPSQWEELRFGTVDPGWGDELSKILTDDASTHGDAEHGDDGSTHGFFQNERIGLLHTLRRGKEDLTARLARVQQEELDWQYSQADFEQYIAAWRTATPVVNGKIVESIGEKIDAMLETIHQKLRVELKMYRTGAYGDVGKDAPPALEGAMKMLADGLFHDIATAAAKLKSSFSTVVDDHEHASASVKDSIDGLQQVLVFSPFFRSMGKAAGAVILGVV